MLFSNLLIYIEIFNFSSVLVAIRFLVIVLLYFVLFYRMKWYFVKNQQKAQSCIMKDE